MADALNADQNVNVGEVYRLFERLDRRLDTLVTRNEFEGFQKATEQRMLLQEKDLADRAAAAAAEHARLDADRDKAQAATHQEVLDLRKEVREQKKTADDAEEKRRTGNKTTWTSIGLAILAVVLGIFRDFFVGGIH